MRPTLDGQELGTLKRVTINGIILKPYVPNAWDGFQVIRKYRDMTYYITVKKGNSSNLITCNGKEISPDQPLPITSGDLRISVLT